MSGFLDRISERAAGVAPVLRPRPLATFEPDTGAALDPLVDTGHEAAAPPPKQQNRPMSGVEGLPLPPALPQAVAVAVAVTASGVAAMRGAPMAATVVRAVPAEAAAASVQRRQTPGVSAGAGAASAVRAAQGSTATGVTYAPSVTAAPVPAPVPAPVGRAPVAAAAARTVAPTEHDAPPVVIERAREGALRMWQPVPPVKVVAGALAVQAEPGREVSTGSATIGDPVGLERGRGSEVKDEKATVVPLYPVAPKRADAGPFPLALPMASPARGERGAVRAAEQAGPVEIHIGRVEILGPAVPAASTSSPAMPAVSLDDYLVRRQ